MSSPEIAFKTTRVLDKDVEVVAIRHHRIYLLGTNHLSGNCARIANRLIRDVAPHVVAVELCRRRLELINELGSNDLAAYLRQYRQLENVPRHLRRRAAAEMLRLRISSQALKYASRWFGRRHSITKFSRNSKGYRIKPIKIEELAISGDIFAPFRNLTWYLDSPIVFDKGNDDTPPPNGDVCSFDVLRNSQAGYRILLADVPIERTYAKLASSLNDNEKETIKRYENDFVRLFLRNRTGIMRKIWRANSGIAEAMIDDRNRHLAYVLLKAIRVVSKRRVSDDDDDDDNNIRRRNTKYDRKNEVTATTVGEQGVRVVGLVGRRHVSGILEIWKTKDAAEWLKKLEYSNLIAEEEF